LDEAQGYKPNMVFRGGKTREAPRNNLPPWAI
jgi:hypothetical protein